MSNSNEPPTSINPYSIFCLSKSATPAEIKSAYKKLALRLHPDKVPQANRSTAHTKFQELTLAYAILSDPRRRSHYDSSGSTSESLEIENDDFNWTSFFRAQYADLVTVDKIRNFKSEYQGSEEESRDILAAYVAAKGRMKGVYDRVMLSNMVADEERFRQIIDRAISKGAVDGLPAFLNETDKQREKRIKRAAKEQQEAEEHAKRLGLHSTLYGGDESGRKSPAQNGEIVATAPESELVALIEKRVKGRMENFLDNLEEKYAPKSKLGGRGKKDGAVVLDDPPEEAFEAMTKRSQKGMAEKEKPLPNRAVKTTTRGKKRSAEVFEGEMSQNELVPQEVEEGTYPLAAPTKKKRIRQTVNWRESSTMD